MRDGTQSFALKIGERYYCGIKKGKLMTAWSLAGAKLSTELSDELRQAYYLALIRNRKPEIIVVGWLSSYKVTITN